MERRGNADNSDPREGNVFKSIGTRGHVPRIGELGLRKVILADTTRAIEGGHVSGLAPVDDAFTANTRDIGNAGERRAIPANRGVGREREHAATTLARAIDPSVRGTAASSERIAR